MSLMIFSEQQLADSEGVSVEDFRYQNRNQQRQALSRSSDYVVYHPIGESDDHVVQDERLKAEFDPCPHCGQAMLRIVERRSHS